MTPRSPPPLAVCMYLSRWPTLRTVRITGDGEVWVDGVRRRWNVAQRVAMWTSCGYSVHGIMDEIARTADAMEVVR